MAVVPPRVAAVKTNDAILFPYQSTTHRAPDANVTDTPLARVIGPADIALCVAGTE